MSKPAASTMLPEFKLPEYKLPKFNLDALFTAQKANLAVVQEVQSVLVDAAQAVVRIQYGWVAEMIASGEGALQAKQPAKPEDLVADMQNRAEKAMGVAKEFGGPGDRCATAGDRAGDPARRRQSRRAEDSRRLNSPPIRAPSRRHGLEQCCPRPFLYGRVVSRRWQATSCRAPIGLSSGCSAGQRSNT